MNTKPSVWGCSCSYKKYCCWFCAWKKWWACGTVWWCVGICVLRFNRLFICLMVNLKFLEKVMLEKKQNSVYVSTVHWKKTHLCSGNLSPCFGIFVWFLWCLILVGQFLGFLWDCCGVRFWSAHFWDSYGICVEFWWNLLWDFVGLLWCLLLSGWPKTTEQIVELPWLQSK